MAKRPVPNDRSGAADAVETFVAGTGSPTRWADQERRPILEAEYERLGDEYRARDVEFPPEIPSEGGDSVRTIVRDYVRQLQDPEV